MTTFKHNGLYLTFGGSYLSKPTPDTAFRIKVDTTKEGSAINTMIIPTNGEGYDFSIDWGDGTIEDISGTSPTVSHIYNTGGEYKIDITGTFPKIYFNNIGDKLKVLEVLNFGDYGTGISDQQNAFHGCGNLISISGYSNGINTSLVNGYQMFNLCGSLTSMSNNITFENLETGSRMFRQCGLDSLSENINLSKLTLASAMFANNNISELPEFIHLISIVDGSGMFVNCSITSILGIVTLSNLSNGSTMFLGNTINTEDYSNLLIRMEANNVNTGVSFHGGHSKYNLAGQEAKNALLARGWTIEDGGLEV